MAENTLFKWNTPPLTTELRALCMDRARLFQQLAPLQKLVGPSHPQRQKELRRRRAARRAVGQALRMNADAIAAIAMRLTGE